VSNGNVSVDETDFVLPGVGFALEFARHYDSQSNRDVGLGTGWLHSYSDRLDILGPTFIQWTTADGHRYLFSTSFGPKPDPPGTLREANGLLPGTLTATGGGYVYHHPDGLTYEFDAQGRLSGKHDRNGNGLALAYDEAGLLATVSDLR